MSRKNETRFRGHTPRSAKLKAIATAAGGVALAVGIGVAVFDALQTGSIQFRRSGSHHHWTDEPLMFVVGVGIAVLMTAFFTLGALGALRNIGWRNWRH